MRLVVSNYLFFPGASRSLLEKSRNKAKTVPQRLKPDCKCGTYGTAEAVPLSKTEYFNKLLKQGAVVLATYSATARLVSWPSREMVMVISSLGLIQRLVGRRMP